MKKNENKQIKRTYSAIHQNKKNNSTKQTLKKIKNSSNSFKIISRFPEKQSAAICNQDQKIHSSKS